MLCVSEPTLDGGDGGLVPNIHVVIVLDITMVGILGGAHGGDRVGVQDGALVGGRDHGDQIGVPVQVGAQDQTGVQVLRRGPTLETVHLELLPDLEEPREDRVFDEVFRMLLYTDIAAHFVTKPSSKQLKYEKNVPK